MKAVEISEHGSADVLRPTARPAPRPSAADVLIRVAYAGVNRPDILQRMGFYPPPPGASDLPGLEVSGEIVEVGAEVCHWRIGDKVCALLTGGGYAEYALAHEGSCLPVPKGLSMAQAASLPETYFTVWANLYECAGLKTSEKLLIHGAVSGIGVAAISMAKAFGSYIFATAGTAEKCAAAMRIGANETFNYNADPWDDKIKEAGGVDVVLDMAGGDFYARNISCLTDGGRLVSIAFLRGREGSVNIQDIMRKRIILTGSTMKSRSFEEKKRLAASLKEEIWPLIERGEITPLVDRVFALEEAAAAHKYMENGRHIGKIVLKIA